MQDRVPLYPGRVTLTPVAGQANTYDMARADQPTQEGTPLNKANLLSDQVASLIGLTSAAVPNDMFNVLATVGDLHVWRRTVTEPASYEIGPVVTGPVNFGGKDDSNYYPSALYSSTVNVSEDGELSLESPNSWQIDPTPGGPELAMARIRGKFFSIAGNGNSFFEKNSIYYCPSDAVFTGVTTESPAYLSIDKYQTVTVVPPGTYIDYPVSVNPNAYQEGDDAQPAGYTLGAVQSGEFAIRPSGSDAITWRYGDTIIVSDEGKISIQDIQYTTITDSSNVSDANVLIGKFATLHSAAELEVFDFGSFYYFPDDASFNQGSDNRFYVSQYQTVTGYPAIPAGTTIEYLGKLGDKARIVTGSYVGTGTYGRDNPNKLDFDSPPKIVFVSPERNSSVFTGIFVRGVISVMLRSNVYVYTKWSENGLSWYTTENTPVYQLNDSGAEFYYIAIL